MESLYFSSLKRERKEQERKRIGRVIKMATDDCILHQGGRERLAGFLFLFHLFWAECHIIKSAIKKLLNALI